MDMVLFVAEYKWFILAFVLVVMLVVGYIADATDFGHRRPSKKTKAAPIKNPNKVEEVEENIVDNKEDLNIPFGDTIKLPKIEAEPPMEDLNVPLEDVKSMEFQTPTLDMNEDLNVPLESVKPLKEPVTENLTEVKDIDGTPVSDLNFENPTDEFVKEKEVKAIEETKKSKESKEKLVPEYIAEEYKPEGDVTSEDDIWNF